MKDTEGHYPGGWRKKKREAGVYMSRILKPEKAGTNRENRRRGKKEKGDLGKTT